VHENRLPENVESDPQERVAYRRMHHAPTQSTTSSVHYLEISDASPHEVDVNRDQELASVDDDGYDNPELPYDSLDVTTAVSREAAPSIYDRLTH